MSVRGSDLPGRMWSVTLVSGICALCAESSLEVSFRTGFLRRRNGCQPIVRCAGTVAQSERRADVQLLCNRLRSVLIGNQGGFTVLRRPVRPRCAPALSKQKKNGRYPGLIKGAAARQIAVVTV